MGDKDVVKEGDVEVEVEAVNVALCVPDMDPDWEGEAVVDCVEETQVEGLPVTLCVLLGEPVEDVELQGEELTLELPDRVTLEQAVGDTE